jgi:hypothetical protein
MAEPCLGTSTSRPDTDGDGLMDGEDVWRGCEPLVPDTDADGWQDGAEAAAGASCREEEDVPGFHSVFECEPEMNTANAFPGDHYYPYDSLISGIGGDYCTCSLTLGASDALPSLGGISAYQAVSALADTSWASTPFPLAMAVHAPSGATYRAEGSVGDAAGVDAIVDAVVSGEPVWMGFNEPFLEDAVSQEVSVTGVWRFDFTLVHRGATVSSESAALIIPAEGPSYTCRAFTDRPGGSAIRVRFDPPPTYALAAPAVPPADPRACTPGASTTTRFTIVDVGPRPRLVRTGGSERYAGARPVRARVVDWRGADHLEARVPGGASAALAAGSWTALPADATLPELRLAAGRAAEGAWRSPIIEVEHRCDAPPAIAPQLRYRLSWAEADAAGRALAGVGAAAALGADPGSATPMQASIWPAAEGSPALLQFISPGVGALLSLRLAPDGPGAHRVVGGLPAGLTVDARVIESPSTLRLEVRGGTWTSPLGALPLGAVSLRLPRVGG